MRIAGPAVSVSVAPSGTVADSVGCILTDSSERASALSGAGVVSGAGCEGPAFMPRLDEGMEVESNGVYDLATDDISTGEVLCDAEDISVALPDPDEEAMLTAVCTLCSSNTCDWNASATPGISAQTVF